MRSDESGRPSSERALHCDPVLSRVDALLSRGLLALMVTRDHNHRVSWRASRWRRRSRRPTDASEIDEAEIPSAVVDRPALIQTSTYDGSRRARAPRRGRLSRAVAGTHGTGYRARRIRRAIRSTRTRRSTRATRREQMTVPAGVDESARAARLARRLPVGSGHAVRSRSRPASHVLPPDDESVGSDAPDDERERRAMVRRRSSCSPASGTASSLQRSFARARARGACGRCTPSRRAATRSPAEMYADAAPFDRRRDVGRPGAGEPARAWTCAVASGRAVHPRQAGVLGARSPRIPRGRPARRPPIYFARSTDGTDWSVAPTPLLGRRRVRSAERPRVPVDLSLSRSERRRLRVVLRRSHRRWADSTSRRRRRATRTRSSFVA